MHFLLPQSVNLQMLSSRWWDWLKHRMPVSAAALCRQSVSRKQHNESRLWRNLLVSRMHRLCVFCSPAQLALPEPPLYAVLDAPWVRGVVSSLCRIVSS